MIKKRVIIFEFQDLRYASRARKEAFSLAKKKYIVYLIGFNSSIKKKCIRKILNVNFIEFPLLFKNTNSFFSKMINIVIFNCRLFVYLLFRKANVYHMHDLKLFYTGFLISLIHNNSLIYDAHELHIVKRPKINKKNIWLSKYDNIIECILIKRARLVIQASSERAQYFSKIYNTTLPLVIENHENISVLNQKAIPIRELINIASNSKIIIYTGNISLNNNQRIDNVIKSLQYLNKNIHFCLLGKASKITLKEIDKITSKLGITDRVHVVPPVLSENVVNTISSANIAVIPIHAISLNSEYSALNKVSQSLMAGLPIATSSYKNLEKIVNNNPIGKVGTTFNVNSPFSIATSIKKCLSKKNNTLYKKNALDLAIKHLNWENEQINLFDAYDRILKETSYFEKN